MNILFSGQMIRAIFCGKWQTRRIKKSDQAPYKIGDVLRVREAVRFSVEYDNYKPSEIMKLTAVKYEADGECLVYAIDDTSTRLRKWGKLRPSIFMPNWICRLEIKITNIEKEMLHDISDADVLAEGFSGRDELKALWNMLNKKRGYDWDTNPEVWKISFETIEKEKI